jgi:hypothetical protein
VKSGGRTARGDAMRRREGKLRHIDAQKATGKLDHFGEILGFDDFLDKADQLIDKYDKLPGSMRAEYFTRLRHAVARLRAYLATDVEPRARNALFDTLHAAFDYRSLLENSPTTNDRTGGDESHVGGTSRHWLTTKRKRAWPKP